MKQISIFFVFILITVFSSAQNDGKVYISSEHNDILYIGVDNILKIKAEKTIVDNLSFSISQGSIHKTDKGIIKARVNKRGKAIIKAYNKDKQLAYKEFNCFGIPDPMTALKVGNKSYKYDEISHEELLKADKLIGDIGPNFDIKFTVTKFVLSANVNGTEVSANSNSEYLTQEQKTILQQIRKGSKIYFEEVFCVGPDGTRRVLPNLILTLK